MTRRLEAYLLIKEVMEAKYFQDSPFRQAVELFLNESEVMEEVEKWEKARK